MADDRGDDPLETPIASPDLTAIELPHLLGDVFERSPLPMVVTRLTDGTYLAVNDAFCQVSGYPREEILGVPSTQVARWADSAQRDAMVEGLRSKGSAEDVRGQFVTKDGAIRTGVFSAIVTRWGSEPAVFALLRDMTDKVEAEAEERLSSSWLRAMFDSAFDGIAIHRDGVLLEANDPLARIFGYERGAELIGMNAVTDLCAPEYREVMTAAIRTGSTDPYVVHVIHRDGTARTAEISGRPIEYRGKPARVASVRELTDLHAAQDAVREANERYRTIVENVPAVTYVWDSANIQSQLAADFVSPQIEALLGYTVAEWQGDLRLWHRMVHPEDLARVIQSWNDAVASGAPFREEYRITTKAGVEKWIRDEAHQFRYDDAGNPRWQGVMYDITEAATQRIEILERDLQLAESEERFRTLVEEIPAITFVEEWVDPDREDASIAGNPAQYVSPQFEAITGFSNAERLEDPNLWRNHLHPDDRERVLALDEISSRDGTPLIADYRMVLPGNRTVWLHEETRLVRDAEGEPLFWLGVQLDITEQMLAQERLAAFNTMANAIIGAASPRQIALEAMTHLRTAVGAYRASVLSVDTAEGVAVPLAADADTPIDLDMPPIPLASITDVKQLLAGEPRIYEDLLTVEKVSPMVAMVREQGIRSITTIPLMDQGTLIGLVSLESKEPSAFDRDTLTLTQEIAGPLAVALQQARLREEVEQTAEDLERSLTDLRIADAQRRSLLARLVTAQEEERQRIAEATTITVRIADTDGGISVRIADDGRGIDDPQSPPGHLGVSAMRERATIAGGRLSIGPGKTGGTIVECWLPL